jgi:hypothetical protein
MTKYSLIVRSFNFKNFEVLRRVKSAEVSIAYKVVRLHLAKCGNIEVSNDGPMRAEMLI